MHLVGGEEVARSRTDGLGDSAQVLADIFWSVADRVADVGDPTAAEARRRAAVAGQERASLAGRETFRRHLNVAHEAVVAMDQQLHCCGLVLLH